MKVVLMKSLKTFAQLAINLQRLVIKRQKSLASIKVDTLRKKISGNQDFKSLLKNRDPKK